jgi:SAM-dependent methyltransferase
MQTVAECRLALRQLKHILGDVRRDKLSDNRFDEAHELFERSSDQQNLILDWLIAYCVQHAATDPYRLLSVGCGSGILDNPLLNALADLDREILYTGIDPNAVACERFRKNFMRSESPSIELIVRQESVETISCDQQFDIVQVVHALYYFDDPAATITELLSRIAEGGKLLVFQAPRAELNQLAECFWFHHQEPDIGGYSVFGR